MPDKTLIVIIGPTAIGKTAWGIKIASALETEIISADSRQFYREMNIGTAKPCKDELAAIKHHFVNSLSITQDFSVGDFEQQGLEILNTIFSTKQTAVLVGGSGLYIDAICRGFDNIPKTDPVIRNQLSQIFAQQGILPLQLELKNADPVYYNEVDLNNPQRIIRALEVYKTSGKPFSEFRTKNQQQRPFKIIRIGLNTDREQLYNQIGLRTEQMISAGLIEEAHNLYPYRYLNALHTVGYTELFEHFDGKTSLQEAKTKIKQNTRRFAKRQLTWFRKYTAIKWFEPADSEGILKAVDL